MQLISDQPAFKDPEVNCLLHENHHHRHQLFLHATQQHWHNKARNKIPSLSSLLLRVFYTYYRQYYTVDTMTTKDSIGPAATTFVTTLAAVATIVGISLPILQSDAASRRLLSPERLQAKRQAEYCYRWDWTLTKAIVESRGGRDQEMDRVDTELLLTPDEVAQFVKNVVMKNPTRILSMELDDQDSRATREYFIFLTIQGLLYQAPLVLFGEELAKAMEDEFTGTAFCFITDASSGYGPKVLATVLEQSKAGLVSCVCVRPIECYGRKMCCKVLIKEVFLYPLFTIIIYRP